MTPKLNHNRYMTFLLSTLFLLTLFKVLKESTVVSRYAEDRQKCTQFVVYPLNYLSSDEKWYKILDHCLQNITDSDMTSKPSSTASFTDGSDCNTCCDSQALAECFNLDTLSPRNLPTAQTHSKPCRSLSLSFGKLQVVSLAFLLIIIYFSVVLSSTNNLFRFLAFSHIMCTVHGQTLPPGYSYSLPYNCFSVAIGYDSVDNIFHLISGKNTAQCLAQYVTFDIDNDIFFDESPFALTIQQPGTNNNWYVQVEDILYLVDYVSTGIIHTFDVRTEAYVSDVIDLPTNLASTSCWTSLADTANNTYIVGFFGDTAYFYSLTLSSWRTTATLTTARRNVACVSSGTVLYIIGGEENNNGKVDFTEVLIYTYATDTFETLADTLSATNGVRNSKAILYGNYIYNIGGDDDDDIDIYYSTIDVIEPLDFDIDSIASYKLRTDLISPFTHSLSDELSKVAAIILDPFLYIFGGKNASSVGVHTSDKIAIFPTISPTTATSAPTQPPTEGTEVPTSTPSAAPTKLPTTPPSAAPSSAPTKAPSVAPSYAPTTAPSVAPTAPPSAAPTKAPTVPPSRSPSGSPSNAPSTQTNAPSMSPTTAPTEAPTPFGPTPAPTDSENVIYLDKTGCDCNQYCNNESAACLSIDFAFECFIGNNGCNSQGNDGNGEIKLGSGDWVWPSLLELNYDDEQIIISGNGANETMLYYNDASFIGCRWHKCWLQINNLTLSSYGASNVPQIYMFQGGTLIMRNVVFNGENYNTNKNGNYFWILQDEKVNVMFIECIFINNDVIYHISNGATVDFVDCTFSDNVFTQLSSVFVIRNAFVTFNRCHFYNNSIANGAFIDISNSSNFNVANSDFIGNDINILINATDSNVFNTFGCLQASESALVFDTNLFTNNIFHSLFIITSTSLYFADNIFDDNVCNSLTYCLESVDSAISLDLETIHQYDQYNFASFDHVSSGSQSSICINGTNVREISKYLFFSSRNNDANTKVIFNDCIDTFSTLHPNISSIILSDSEQVHLNDEAGGAVLDTFICNDTFSTCSIVCNSSVSCFSSIFIINTPIANVACGANFACGYATINRTHSRNITANHNTSLNIICDDESSCLHTTINVDEVDLFELDCVVQSACDNTEVYISNTIASSITCHHFGACDSLIIHTDSDNTTLTMYEYSKDIIFATPTGFTANNLICNPDNAYIVLDDAFTSIDDSVATQFPYLSCADVTFHCNVTESCNIQYIDYYDESVLLNDWHSFFDCYAPIDLDELYSLQCIGTCAESPSVAPTNAPSFAPTGNTTQPTIAPSISPSFAPSQNPSFSPSLSPTQVPTLSPSYSPSSSPTNTPSHIPSSSPSQSPSSHPSSSPTAAPVMSPTHSPTEAPTMTPSISPTNIPSISPTQSPSRTPTQTPSLHPTLTPSQSPTKTPTQSPSFSPTLAPSSPPSNAPSLSPILAPTFSPSLSPSFSPTRSPISSDDFDSFLLITFLLTDVTNENKLKIVQNPVNVTKVIEAVIENEYFWEGILSYDKYMVNILEIEGIQISEIDTNAEIAWTNLDELRLNSTVECKADDENINYCESIKQQSQPQNTFASRVETILKDYFANDMLGFEVYEAQTLAIECKDCPDGENDADPEYQLYALIAFVGFLCFLSILAFVYNKGIIPKLPGFNYVDDARWASLMMFALQFWDFYSDINLSVEIVQRDDFLDDVLVLISGIGSIVFILIPYIANLIIAANIKSIIRTNAAAKGWFQYNTPIFTLLVVLSGGVHAALALVSSGVFGLKVFNCGLTQYELKGLGRLKVFGTVVLENVPQLFCQALYTSVTGISSTVIMAFVASILSVIASTLSFWIEKDTADTKVVQYYVSTQCSLRTGADLTTEDLEDIHELKMKTNVDIQETETKSEDVKEADDDYNALSTHSQLPALKNNMITDQEKRSFIDNRGKTMALGESIAQVFGVSPKNIEVGYSMMTKYGVITHIVHYIYEDDVEAMQQELMENGMGHIIFTAQSFAQHLFKEVQRDIGDVFRFHFELNRDFKVTYRHRLDHRRKSTLPEDKNKDATGNKEQGIKRGAILQRMVTKQILISDPETNTMNVLRKCFNDQGVTEKQARFNLCLRLLKEMEDNEGFTETELEGTISYDPPVHTFEIENRPIQTLKGSPGISVDLSIDDD